MTSGALLSVGNFDGVHLGHRAILAEARRAADARGLKVLALAFDPHPAGFLRPGCEPPPLMTADEKRQALLEAGADEVQFLTPTAALLGQSPRQFVGGLVERHRMRAIVEGSSFRFGKDRAGDVTLLRQLGGQFDFDVRVVPAVEVSLSDQILSTVSSTLVRWLLACGRVRDAARCLGNAYPLAGVVDEGAREGRKLGVPTANLESGALGAKLLPADGVYAGRARLEEGRTFPAAISIGCRPTHAGKRRLVEAHLLDFRGDLYGRRMCIEPMRWLRDQQAFASVAILKAQLERDVARTRRLHEQRLLDGDSGRAWSS